MDTHFLQLSPDLTIHQAEIFHTNTGIIKTKKGIVLVDPAFTQADLERIAAFIGPEPILAGFSTHAHYDHLFWSALFGDETPRYCSEGSLELVKQQHEDILSEARSFENDLFNLNSLLLYTHLSHLSSLSPDLFHLSEFSVEVVPIPGHLSGQSALLFPEFRVLFAADTLSDVEPPSIEGSRKSLLDYLDSLKTLERLLDRVDWIIPGHGSPANPVEAKRRLEMDRIYLRALLTLTAKDFVGSSEALGRSFLEQIKETRAENPDTRQIHQQNLDFTRQWL